MHNRSQLHKLGAVVLIAGLSIAAVPFAAFGQEGVVTPPAAAQKPASGQSGVNPGLFNSLARRPEGLSAHSSQQNPPQTQSDPQTAITKPVFQSPEIGHERIGVDLNDVKYLTLQDAITMGLEKNLDIENFRQGVQIAQYNLFSSKGVYDITSSSQVNYRSQTSPVTQTFQGGGSAPSITTRTLTYNFLTSQLIEKTGGQWQVELDNNRTSTNSPVTLFPSLFTSTLTATLVQPLLRNLSVDANRHNIQLLKASLDISDSQFRQRVIEIINQIQDAYWDLVFAIRNEQIARDTVDLAKVQLENNRRQVEAGTLAPIELRSNEALLETDKGNVVLALQAITTSENVLKGLILGDPNGKLWNAVLKPTDEPQKGQPVPSVSEAIGLAFRNRPELEQMKLTLLQTQIDVKFYRNQTKPQLDFLGIYGGTGLAGSPSNAIVQSNTLNPFTTSLLNGVNQSLGALNLTQIPAPVPVTSTLGSSVPGTFNGSFPSALRNLFSQNYKTYQFGVQFSFPWKNRTAEGNLGRSLATERQINARMGTLLQSVEVDVRNALQNVQAARQRFDAGTAGREAAQAQYEGELERFRAGLSTNFQVEQRLTDLANARGTELRALTDYNKALSDLQRVTGLTLVSNNVQVPPSSTASNGRSAYPNSK